jgi:hypothetical protein
MDASWKRNPELLNPSMCHSCAGRELPFDKDAITLVQHNQKKHKIREFAPTVICEKCHLSITDTEKHRRECKQELCKVGNDGKIDYTRCKTWRDREPEVGTLCEMEHKRPDYQSTKTVVKHFEKHHKEVKDPTLCEACARYHLAATKDSEHLFYCVTHDLILHTNKHWKACTVVDRTAQWKRDKISRNECEHCSSENGKETIHDHFNTHHQETDIDICTLCEKIVSSKTHLHEYCPTTNTYCPHSSPGHEECAERHENVPRQRCVCGAATDPACTTATGRLCAHTHLTCTTHNTLIRVGDPAHRHCEKSTMVT